MILFGIILLGILAVGSFILCLKYSDSLYPALGVILLFVIGLFSITVGIENSKENIKKEVLITCGIEPLTKEEVYNKSQAELDKYYKISTLENGIQYFVIEK